MFSPAAASSVAVATTCIARTTWPITAARRSSQDLIIRDGPRFSLKNRSERQDDRAWNERRVVDAYLFAEPEAHRRAHQAIEVAPGAEDARVLVVRRLEHREVGPRRDLVALRAGADLGDREIGRASCRERV